MQQFAKILILAGAVLMLIGIVLFFGKHIPFIGRLPGDIHIDRPNFKFYFPITTCIILSILLSLILYIISRFR